MAHGTWLIREVKVTFVQVEVEKLVFYRGKEIAVAKVIPALFDSLEESRSKLGELSSNDRMGEEKLENLVLNHVCEYPNAHLQ